MDYEQGIIYYTGFLVPDNHFPASPKALLSITVIKPTASSQREVDHHAVYELIDGHGSIQVCIISYAC